VIERLDSLLAENLLTDARARPAHAVEDDAVAGGVLHLRQALGQLRVRDVHGSRNVARVVLVRRPDIEDERRAGRARRGAQLRGRNVYGRSAVFVVGDGGGQSEQEGEDDRAESGA